ncbi:hypothetical protein [Streptomyces sp. NPDC051211]|uniref:hypothetical protein n=1 Tax=Streptomyces sp. NPDC051211 TaxID=3154643 RepID=UPI003450A701
MARDPGGELGRRGVEDDRAGDQGDPLDSQLPGAQLASPADDLDGLAGAGMVEVVEDGDLEPADLLAVVDPVAGRAYSDYQKLPDPQPSMTLRYTRERRTGPIPDTHWPWIHFALHRLNTSPLKDTIVSVLKDTRTTSMALTRSV